MVVYLNARYGRSVETIDEFNSSSHTNIKEFFVYVKKMMQEYRMAGIPVYISSRSTKEWRNGNEKN
jgi:hypothetical protein